MSNLTQRKAEHQRSCYAMVERNKDWQKAMDDMIDNSIKVGELRKLLERKVEMMTDEIHPELEI